MTSALVWAALTLSVLVFVAALRLMKAEPAARRALEVARRTSVAMRDPALDDMAKARVARGASVSLLGGCAHLALAGVAALAAAGALIRAGAQAGLYSLAQVEATALDWPFLLGSCALAAIAWAAISRLRRDKGDPRAREEPAAQTPTAETPAGTGAAEEPAIP